MLGNLRKPKHMGKEDIGLERASRYYRIPVRNMHRRWKSAILAKKRAGPPGISFLIMQRAFVLISIF
jgi:hypothetical protein